VITVRIPLPVSQPERVVPPVVGDLPHGFGSYDDMAEMRARVGLVALEQKRKNDEQSYDARTAENVMARLRALDPQPSLVVNEHDCIVACWRLSQRVTDTASPAYRLNIENVPVPSNANMSRFGLLHHRLAMRLAGDTSAAARPFMLLVDAPGIRRQVLKIGNKPGPVVTAEIWNDNTYALETLEALATAREVTRT